MCCYTLNLSLKCTHISVSHVLVVASHQTFRENISGNIYYWWFKKILVLRSVDIFYFLYQTICQKYKVLLILDKIPDKTILWQLQCSNKSNAQDRLPTLSSRLSQPLWMLLSCFSSGVRAEFISRDSLTVFCFWFFVFFLCWTFKGEIRQCKFRLMCLQIVQFWADGSTRERVALTVEQRCVNGFLEQQ